MRGRLQRWLLQAILSAELSKRPALSVYGRTAACRTAYARLSPAKQPHRKLLELYNDEERRLTYMKIAISFKSIEQARK